MGLKVIMTNLEKINDTISTSKIYVAYPGNNRKKINITKQAMINAIPTLIGTPVVAFFFDNGKIGGHEGNLVNNDGTIKRTGKPIPFGFVAQDYEPHWETLQDGNEYLCAKVYLWTKRYPHAERIIGKDQSMEILVNDMSIKDDYKIINDFSFVGLCALEGIEPTFELSHFEEFSDDDMLKQLESMKTEFLSLNDKLEIANFCDLSIDSFDEEFGISLDEFTEICFDKELTNFPKKGDNKKVSLRNSKYPIFDVEYSKNLKENYPDIWSKGGNILGNTQYKRLIKIIDNDYKVETSTDEKAIRLREAWMARHYKDKLIAGVVAQVKWLGIGSRGEKYMKNLIKKEKKKKEEFVLDAKMMKKLAQAIFEKNPENMARYIPYAFDEKMVYVLDMDENKPVMMPYVMKDEMAMVDMEKMGYDMKEMDYNYKDYENMMRAMNTVKMMLEEKYQMMKEYSDYATLKENAEKYSKELTEAQGKYIELKEKFSVLETLKTKADEQIEELKKENLEFNREKISNECFSILEGKKKYISKDDLKEIENKINEKKYEEFSVFEAELKDCIYKNIDNVVTENFSIEDINKVTVEKPMIEFKKDNDEDCSLWDNLNNKFNK